MILSSISQNDIKSIIDEAKEPKWLSEIRENAFSRYLDLPPEVSPLYKKYSDVNRLKPDHIYIPDRSTKHEPYGDLRARLDELEQGISIVQIGSTINRISVPNELLNQGIIISDLDRRY